MGHFVKSHPRRKGGVIKVYPNWGCSTAKKSHRQISRLKNNMPSEKLYENSFSAMGSPCSISLYSRSSQKAKDAFLSCKDEVQRLETAYSRYRPESVLSEINRVAEQGGKVEVDEETSTIIEYANACFIDSDGLFDITSGVLGNAWNKTANKLPSPELVERLLTHVGWEKVFWNSPRLEFLAAGMQLDLGGIVKEYAVDRLAELLLAQDILHGVVNLGGDIRVIGPHADGTPWRVGITDPQGKELALQYFDIEFGALATSGDYERCQVINGIRYGHIINPKTGWPVSYLASATVASDLCIVAGSVSTIALLKEFQGPEWLHGQGLPHYWVDHHGKSGGSLCQP